MDTLRFYERQGIIRRALRLPRSSYRHQHIGPPRRNSANWGVYEKDAVRRVRFVKHAQEVGFSLTEIKELLGLRLRKNATCAEVRDKAMAKVGELDRKIQALRDMRGTLSDLAKQCPVERPVSECPILDAFDD